MVVDSVPTTVGSYSVEIKIPYKRRQSKFFFFFLFSSPFFFLSDGSERNFFPFLGLRLSLVRSLGAPVADQTSPAIQV